MDIANLIPEIAKQLGIAPSTLAVLIFLAIKGADALARYIPSDATGWLGAVRKICKFIGINVSNRITSGVTATDAARVSLGLAPVDAKVDVETQSALSPDSRARTENGQPATRLVSMDAMRNGSVPTPAKRVATIGDPLPYPDAGPYDAALEDIARTLDRAEANRVIGPDIPGDALNMPAEPVDEDAEFNALYAQWQASSAPSSPMDDVAPFKDFLKARGWAYKSGKWQKVGEA
jgi:hypothetical protein